MTEESGFSDWSKPAPRSFTKAGSWRSLKARPFTFAADTFYFSVDCTTGEITYGNDKLRKRAEQLKPLLDAFDALLRTIPEPE